MRSLNLDGYRFTRSGKNSLMDLTERRGGGTLTFQDAEDLLDRFAQFCFNHRNNVGERCRGHFVLQRTDGSQACSGNKSARELRNCPSLIISTPSLTAVVRKATSTLIKTSMFG